MNKVIKPYSLEEESTLDLLNAIYKQKRAIKCSKWNVWTLIILCTCIIPTIVFFFNFLHIRISLLYEFLQDLLNILSILVGFTITALSIIGTGLSKEVIQLLSNYELQQNKNAHHSIYHTTILIFFEYIYSLLITLSIKTINKFGLTPAILNQEKKLICKKYIIKNVIIIPIIEITFFKHFTFFHVNDFFRLHF